MTPLGMLAALCGQGTNKFAAHRRPGNGRDMSWADYAGVFVIGLLGTGHCVGMCGGFALAVGAGAQRPMQVIWRQLAYQFGKATSYLLIGLVLLVAGSLTAGIVSGAVVQNTLGVVAGLLMIALGVAYASEWRGPGRLARWLEGLPACGALAAVWPGASLARSLLLGCLNGLLPCGLSLAVLVHLASRGSVAAVVGGAYVFGFATLPGLLGFSWLGRGWGATRRRWLVRAGGVALILFGLLTLVRGRPEVHHWFHRHLVIEATATPPAPAAHECCP